MHIHDVEFKLTNDAVLKLYGDHGTLSFYCAAKDQNTDYFNPVVLARCTLRTTAQDAQDLYGRLVRGKRVKLTGNYEGPAFENAGDPTQFLAIEHLDFAIKAPKVDQDAESALVA